MYIFYTNIFKYVAPKVLTVTFVDELTTLLRDLGFNEYQSRVFSCLAQNREATALDISEKTAIPYTKIYAVIEPLVFAGMVKSSFSRPKRYNLSDPVAIKEYLIKQKQEELKNMRSIAKKTCAMMAQTL